MNACIVTRFSDQPLPLEVGLGSGILSALGEGIAPQDAPYPAQDPRNDAKIVDAPLGIFRTGRPVKAGPARKILLVKTDHADAQPLQIGLKHLLLQKDFQKRRVSFQEFSRCDRR